MERKGEKGSAAQRTQFYSTKHAPRDSTCAQHRSSEALATCIRPKIETRKEKEGKSREGSVQLLRFIQGYQGTLRMSFQTTKTLYQHQTKSGTHEAHEAHAIQPQATPHNRTTQAISLVIGADWNTQRMHAMSKCITIHKGHPSGRLIELE